MPLVAAEPPGHSNGTYMRFRRLSNVEEGWLEVPACSIVDMEAEILGAAECRGRIVFSSREELSSTQG